MTCWGKNATHISDRHSLKQEVGLIALLKDCARSKDIERGVVVHADVAERGSLDKNIYVGNALICLYARCGAVAKAQDVFNRLPVRDVVSWNTLIAGYAQDGNSIKAFECFGRMKLEGSSPDAITLVSTLKAYGSERALNKGREIHAEIVEREMLDGNIMVGTALVAMYAKCGALEKAQGVFDHLPVRDVVCWNALISGYSQHGNGDNALKCFRQMQLDTTVTPNAVTFLCVLKACSSISAIEIGEQIHREMLRSPLLMKNAELGNALLDMYAKCSALGKAENVFHQLEVRNVVSWNTMITAYLQFGDVEKALCTFDQMQREGCTPDSVTLICMLKACGCIGSSEKGEEIHAEIIKKGFLEEDALIGTALVDMYAKCGALGKAKDVFLRLSLQDIVAWGALIAGYAQYGQSDDALICFEQMQMHGFSPDIPILVSILKACTSNREMQMGREIHTEIVCRGFLEEDILTVLALVDMYAKLSAFVDAQRVFDKTLFRNVVLWNALITGQVDRGHSEKAENCIERMYSEGICPDEVTILCILKACANVGAIEKGKRMHAVIVKDTSLLNCVLVGTALVDMYAKCGTLGRAQEQFDQLQVRNVVSWNALITGYAQHGHGVDVLNHVQCMQHEGLALNMVTFICMLQACGSIGAAEKGKEIHAEITERKSVADDILVDNAVMDMYAKCGLVTKAHEVSDQLPVKDVVSWTALIAGYAHTGKYEMAIDLFNIMLGIGVEPDDITFAIVLSACSHSGLLDRGQMCFEIMGSCYVDVPTLQQYTCIVDLLGRAGQFNKAAAVIQMMPTANYLPVWSALLGACQKWGNKELGRSAFEHAVRLDDKHTALYVCMSNIYALDQR